MELDRSRIYRLFLADTDSGQGFMPAGTLAPYIAGSPAEAARAAAAQPGDRAQLLFAAAELATALNRVLEHPVEAGRGDEDDSYGLIMLDCPAADAAGDRAETEFGAPASDGQFAWRASERRVEIHGASSSALLGAVYDFLGSLGFFWVAPGENGWRFPAHLRTETARNSGRVSKEGIGAAMILGHREYLEAAEDYILFAARSGYRSVFFHTTSDRIAYGAAPLALYEKLRPSLIPLLRATGLEVELGGHGLSALLPRQLFRRRPELFRMSEGKRSPDHNFCVSNPETLRIATRNFTAFVRAHPEVKVFHVWPDDLPGGGWCSCPECSHIPAGRQALIAASALAAVLEKERPGASLSFLAYHDTEDTGDAARAAGQNPVFPAAAAGSEGQSFSVPPALRLLWAPRRRSWAKGYGDDSSALNKSSRERYERAAALLATPNRAVFEYYEDAILFKGYVPPLADTMAADIGYYAGLPPAQRPESIGILVTGPGLPIAPRPNLWLFPRLLAAANGAGPHTAGKDSAARLFALWQTQTYGAAAKQMGEYWNAVAEASKIDLDIDEGDTEVFMPAVLSRAVIEPPADWGDPWKASAARLSERRSQSDELFARLREAEKALDRAKQAAASAVPDPASQSAADFERDRAGQRSLRELRAVRAEELSYNLDSAIMELDSARIAAYYEAAQGAGASAADIAFIALSIADSAKKAGLAMPSPAARGNLAFLLLFNYELRLRQLARFKFGPVHRALSISALTIRCALSALRTSRNSRA